jgi:hypothetical protein
MTRSRGFRSALYAVLALVMSFVGAPASAATPPSGVRALGTPETAAIPPDGGLASFANGQMTVQAFADPSRGPLTLAYQAVDARTLPPAQSGLSLGFGAFQLSVDAAPDATFSVPLNLAISPGASDLSLALGRPERLFIGTWNGSIWLAAPCATDAVSGAQLVCSVTHTGLFVPLVALPINPALQQFDVSLVNGHFYAQGNGFEGGGMLGYAVTDDDDAPLWSEFQRQGAVPRLGYPVSQRFVDDSGAVMQAFQRGALRWVPELGLADLVDIMEALHVRGDDAWLEATHQIPPAPSDAAPADASILSSVPSVLSAYTSDPALYGSPRAIASYGDLVSARFQRSTLQTFASTGGVISGVPGELARAAGLWPVAATIPAAPDAR